MDEMDVRMYGVTDRFAATTRENTFRERALPPPTVRKPVEIRRAQARKTSTKAREREQKKRVRESDEDDSDESKDTRRRERTYNGRMKGRERRAGRTSRRGRTYSL